MHSENKCITVFFKAHGIIEVLGIVTVNGTKLYLTDIQPLSPTGKRFTEDIREFIYLIQIIKLSCRGTAFYCAVSADIIAKLKCFFRKSILKSKSQRHTELIRKWIVTVSYYLNDLTFRRSLELTVISNLGKHLLTGHSSSCAALWNKQIRSQRPLIRYDKSVSVPYLFKGTDNTGYGMLEDLDDLALAAFSLSEISNITISAATLILSFRSIIMSLLFIRCTGFIRVS